MKKKDRTSKLHVDAVVELKDHFKERFFHTAFLVLSGRATHKDLDLLDKEYNYVLERQQKKKTAWDPSKRGGSEKRV
jgi:hypothetical protein